MGKGNKKNKKSFRIVDLQNLKNNKQTNSTTTILIQKLIRNNKFVYIDINQQSGIKAMEKVSLTDSEEQGEIIGDNLITNLKACSNANKKINQYLNINHEARLKKTRMRSMVESEILKKSKRVIQIQNSQLQPPPLHKGMDSAKIWKYLQQKQLNNLNKVIVEKQERLAAKFGIVSQYQSIEDRNTPSHMSKKKIKQFYLPKILKKRIQATTVVDQSKV